MPYDNMVSIKSYCTEHGIDIKHARRLARANKFGDAVKMFDTVWVVPADMDIPDIPERGTRGARRADGRSRYVVYVATLGELDAIREIVGSDNVTDPRELAKKRRAEKRAAAASESDATDG